MMNEKKCRIIIKTALLIVSIITTGCDFKFNKTDKAYISKSIRESKEKGIYENEYVSTHISINDTIEFTILEAWSEKRVMYSNVDEDGKVKNIDNINSHHVILKLTENIQDKISSFQDTWRFKGMGYFSNEHGNYIYAYNCDLISSNPIPTDSIQINLEYSIPPEKEGEFRKVKPLGDFYLIGKEK